MKKIFIILTLLCFMTGCGEKLEDTNSILNNNPEIIKEQIVNNLKMSNTSLSYKDGISTLTVTVTNTSNESVTVNQFNVIFKTENGSVITVLNGSLGDQIEANSSITINITSDIDLSEAYFLEYQIS